MTSATPTGARNGRLGRWWVLAAALLLTAVACLAVGLHGHQHPLAGPIGPQRPPPTAHTGPVVPAVIQHSIPVSLSIPAIGLSVPLSELGLNLDGTVQVPTSVAEPGWFDLGPSPGQLGSAVILGHVDSYQGPGVFFQLRTLLAGDAVDVTLADGSVADFAVYTVVQYEKTTFPSGLVYTSHGYSALNLVTCGGIFDPQTGHYLSNIVVYTSLVSISTPTSAMPAVALGAD
jgi:hypothetical protein